MKNEEYKKLSIAEFTKAEEDMKVTMRVFTKCVRRTIRIFWKN